MVVRIDDVVERGNDNRRDFARELGARFVRAEIDDVRLDTQVLAEIDVLAGRRAVDFEFALAVAVRGVDVQIVADVRR